MTTVVPRVPPPLFDGEQSLFDWLWGRFLEHEVDAAAIAAFPAEATSRIDQFFDDLLPHERP